MTNTIKPYPFQIECLEEIEWFNGRVLVSLDMGLGKTACAAWYWQRHKQDASPCIVVCPASVKFNWEVEVWKAAGVKSMVLEGTKPPRGKLVTKIPPIIILNYDILQFWVPWLKKLKPKMVVLDEVQNIANPKTKRARAVRSLCRGVGKLLALSGTPILNRPIELFNPLNLLRRSEFPGAWKFMQRYCDPHFTPWGWEYKGASHVDEFHQRLVDSCLVRRRKVDVLKDLPKKSRIVVPLPLSSVAEYQRADKDFVAWLMGIDPDKAKRAAKAEAMTRIGYLLRLAAELKLPYVHEWIANFLEDTDEKLVVFAVHWKVLEELQSKCKYKSVLIDGSITGRARYNAVNQFQTDNKVRVLFGNIKAAGVGITLTAAHTVATAEMAWRPADHEQADDRCYRIGTTEEVNCYYLVARNTVEQKLCKIIQQKQGVVSSVLDGGKMLEDTDIYSQLIGSVFKGTLDHGRDGKIP
ncbi:DEAD/DEAH box helicase [Candidatus Pacearchaeota archaeon]|jgi:SWI/SNF-related matrix-associated actin-dependent regulator 1 of chromatin subfamily A|nr:DEAD/DEAH box helicase [Candidatus Pacearchaeota archaeon]